MTWSWRKHLRSLAYLSFLAPFFFATYGFANWAASQRPAVPSFFFAWESSIPFLPWTIVPYWCSDLLYGVSVFLCRSKRELRTHVSRLIAAQLLCVLSFILFPLRFAFARPDTGGLFGAMFDALTGFDKPFNQAPSLHVTLLVVLWPRFSKYVTGSLRYVLCGCFLLIAMSTLTTYQHHFIDLPLGVVAGLISLGLFPLQATRAAQLHRMTAVYTALAFLFATMAIRWAGLYYFLMWPSVSMALVAGAYWFDKPTILVPNLLIAPYSLAVVINAWLWRRGRPSAHEIADGVWLGRACSAAQCVRQGTRSVVNLAPEIISLGKAEMPVHRIPMLDLVSPSAHQLWQAAHAVQTVGHLRPTLICCALGYGRGAAVAASWLLASGHASTAADAIMLVKAKRPGSVFGRTVARDLKQFAEGRLRECSL